MGAKNMEFSGQMMLCVVVFLGLKVELNWNTLNDASSHLLKMQIGKNDRKNALLEYLINI